MSCLVSGIGVRGSRMLYGSHVRVQKFGWCLNVILAKTLMHERFCEVAGS